MGIEPDRIIAAAAVPRGRGRRPRRAPEEHRRLRGPAQRHRAARHLHPGGAHARRGAGSRADFRAPGPRQDHAGAHHRQRAQGQPAPDLRPGARAARRSGGAADQSRAARRAVRRRDSSLEPGGRGGPVSRHGGLAARSDDRRGPRRALDQARPAAFHAGRRHHAGGPVDLAASRPLRHRAAPGVLHYRGAHQDRGAQRRHPEAEAAARGRDAHRRALARHAAHRQPAAAPGARFRRGQGRRASFPARWRWRRSTCWRSIRRASTCWTASCF